MKTALFALSFAALCGTLASQQPQEVKIPRPPVVTADVKTNPVLLPKETAPGVFSHPAPAVPRAKPDPVDEGWGVDPFDDPDLVVFDALPNGSRWANSGSYKAEFAQDAVRFIPFLGSDAPDNYPVSFRLRDVRIAGEAVRLDTNVAAQRNGQLLSYDRDGVVELYDVRGRGIEQMFRFDELPARGEIVVSIDVDTTLEPQPAPDGFRFGNERGGVSYGRAFALDAADRSVELTTTYDAGRIQIRIPAAFVADATLPLTIDPLVRPFMNVAAGSQILHSPDSAFDVSTGHYIYVWNRIHSATDTDVFSAEYDVDSNPVGGTVTIDGSSESWQFPKVANNNLVNRNLVVAQVSQNTLPGPYRIRGRMRNAGSNTVGAPFTIAEAGLPSHYSGDKLSPDVGGDFYMAGPTYFTVVWQRKYNATDHDIHMKQVSNHLNPQLRSAAPTLIEDSGAYESSPSISESCGAGPSRLQRYVIVYQRTHSPGDEDIYYAMTTWDGQIARAASVLDNSGRTDESPDVSSMTGQYGATSRFWMATYSRGFSINDWDIFASVGDESGARLRVGKNLTLLEPEVTGYPHHGWRQTRPSVATDGYRFAVAYTDDWENSGDFDVRASTFFFHPGPQDVGINESRVWIADSSCIETNVQVTSLFDGGGPALRYGLIWQDGRCSGNNAIEARQYEGYGPGGVSRIPNGCIPLPINFAGQAALGGEMTISTPGFGLLFGTVRAVPFQCGPCQILIDGDSYSPTVSFIIPNNPNLLGAMFLAQGFDVAPGLPCMNAAGFSDTLEIIVR